jgi:hypothetical protein
MQIRSQTEITCHTSPLNRETTSNTRDEIGSEALFCLSAILYDVGYDVPVMFYSDYKPYM